MRKLFDRFEDVLKKMCSRNIVISLGLIFLLVPYIASLPQNSLARRSTFFDIECKGIFNKSVFFRLDRICEDCYSLFREPQVHSSCKANCFGTEYFDACVEALLLKDELEDIQKWRELVGRKK